MIDSEQVLAEHLDTLHAQAAFTASTLHSTARLLEIFVAEPQVDPRKIDALRSQARACQRALRTSNQLLAQAAELLEKHPQPQEAHHDEEHRTSARVG